MKLNVFGSPAKIKSLVGLMNQVLKLDKNQKAYFSCFMQELHIHLKDIQKYKTVSSYEFFWRILKDHYSVKINALDSKYEHDLVTHLACVVDTKFKIALSSGATRRK